MSRNLSEQEILRREKKSEIEKLGISCYPPETYHTNTDSEEIISNYDSNPKKFESVKIAGRIMSRRIMGSASFAELKDDKGKIQIYVSRDSICPGEDKTLYNTVFKKLLDIGDIIGIEGHVFKTKVGEISIHVEKIVLLAKSLKPLPIVKETEGEVYDAYTDPEQRFRQRYVDLIVNSKVKDIFYKRAKVISTLRNYFENKMNCLEVETPVLQPIYGGALAKPFTTHHNALDTEFFLRISPELYHKRLIVGGIPGVYEFSKLFRNEGMSRFHNPEFTAVEVYVAFKDYNWMMDHTEKMIEEVAIATNGSSTVKVGDKEISFKSPWAKYTMYEVIEKFCGVDISDMEEKEIYDLAVKFGIQVDNTMDRGKLIDEIFGEKCEPNLIQPTFITDYPIEMSPLAKTHRDNNKLVERFEVICNGKEISNSYSELNDPIEQRKRFEKQIELKERGDLESMVLDEDFIRALEYGMPPTAGMGIGIDRLSMIMTNSDNIQEVILFPHMRPEVFN